MARPGDIKFMIAASWPTTLTRRNAIALGAVAGLAGCRRSLPPVTLIVGAAAGAGNDGFTRLVAAHLQRLGGRSIRVENEPRAGGKLAARRLATSAADGSVVGFLTPSLIYESLLGQGGEGLDLTQFAWLGSIGADHRVLLVNRQSGVTRFDQVLTRPKPLIIAAATVSSPNYVEPMIINHLTGSRLKAVPGYDGGARNLAVLSGEVDGAVGGLDSLAPMLQSGARVVLRLNDLAIGAGDRVPSLASIARGRDRVPLLHLIESFAALGRMFALPPGAPQAIRADWQAQLKRVVADPLFRADAAGRGYPLEEVSGEQVAATLRRLLDGSTVTVSALRRAMAASPA